jgi:hypothetical protein
MGLIMSWHGTHVSNLVLAWVIYCLDMGHMGRILSWHWSHGSNIVLRWVTWVEYCLDMCHMGLLLSWDGSHWSNLVLTSIYIKHNNLRSRLRCSAYSLLCFEQAKMAPQPVSNGVWHQGVNMAIHLEQSHFIFRCTRDMSILYIDKPCGDNGSRVWGGEWPKGCSLWQ